MAKQEPRFDAEDIERLFRALIPSGGADPFGRLEKRLLELGEEIESGAQLTDEWREKVASDLAHIRARTFGILILQIFKTLKFFLGLLPSGRLMLILLAAVGLLVALAQDGELSLGSIREAAVSTGLAKFIDDIMDELRTFTDELAEQAQSLGNATSEVFVSVSARIDATSESLAIVANQLQPALYGSVTEFAGGMQNAGMELDRIIRNLVPAGNAASNGADLIGPALRGLDDRIRDIPDLALRLVTLR